MRIVFGWNLDQAPWLTAGAGTTVVTGPRGMLGILQTRLGTARPSVDRSRRTAQYRSLLARANHPWFHRSFTDDPWNTAHRLLQMRDEAVEAGWDAHSDDRDLSAHPRLHALAAVEELVVLGSVHDPNATLTPGPADDLREVLNLLRQNGTDWPLGVTTLELRDQRGSLSQVWQDILDAIESAGVTVTQSEECSGSPTLTVVRGREQWSTAEAAARLLVHLPNRERLCIVAGDSTAVLDQQLARRQTPTLGVPGSSTTPSARVLPVFLSAVLPPTDVRRVAEFLHLSFGSTDRGITDGGSRAKKLVPPAVGTPLIEALSQEPGLSDDPESAWMSALHTLREQALSNPDSASTTWDTASALDSFLRAAPPVIDNDEVTLSTLTPALDWLATRLRRLTVNPGTRTEGGATADPSTTDPFISEAATHLASFRAALDRLGTESVRTRELFDVAEACAPTSASVLTSAQAADWTVVTDPASVPAGTDTIVWWCSRRNDTPATESWDPAELAFVAEGGTHIATAADRERLRQAGELRGIRAAARLVCFCPETLRGEPVALHPVLSRLAEGIATEHPERFSSTSVDQVLTDPRVKRTVADLVDVKRFDSTSSDAALWRLLGITVPLSIVDAVRSERPQRVSRTLDGDFTHLLPESLSFTQIDTILSDPQEWVLSKALGLGRGFTFDLPTGNRMIGTLVHAVVEDLVRSGAASNGTPLVEDTVASTLDRLVPRFAAELLLPGQLARRIAVRSLASASVLRLFDEAQRRGFVITGAEVDFTYGWTLTIAGTPRSILLRGQRDLEGVFADGRPVIIDLKWANSDKRYRSMIHDGEAVQLSVYSRTSDAQAQTRPLTAYFMLKQGRFVSTDSGLDSLTAGGADPLDDEGNGLGGDPAGLWPIIEESVEYALSNIVAGRFDSPNADIHAALEAIPGDAERAVDKALNEFKKEELSEGRLFVSRRQTFSDFTLIYGIAGDHS